MLPMFLGQLGHCHTAVLRSDIIGSDAPVWSPPDLVLSVVAVSRDQIHEDPEAHTKIIVIGQCLLSCISYWMFLGNTIN